MSICLRVNILASIPKKKQTYKQECLGQAVIRNYKDSVFRLLFREKKELLSLFNAVNGTHYENPDELEVNTLENAIYMSMKNDISCVMDMRMNLYEHQSTVNPNMPLRYLFYVGALFEKQIRHLALYSRRRILLPTPRFVVLYHGEEEQPERKEMCPPKQGKTPITYGGGTGSRGMHTEGDSRRFFKEKPCEGDEDEYI